MGDLTMRLISRTTVVLAALAVIALPGCGSSDQTAVGSESKAAEGVRGRTLNVAVDADAPPFGFIEQGRPQGFDVDLLDAIAEQVGFRIKRVPLSFEAILPALQSGQVDVATAGIGITPEREEVVDFSIPYLQTGLVIATRPSDTSIDSPERLKGHAVAVRGGSIGARYVDELPFSDTVSAKLFDSNNDIIQAVISGVTDAAIQDRTIFQYFIAKRGNGRIAISSGLLSKALVGMAVHKGEEATLQAIDDGLRSIAQDGTYARIYRKWFGSEPDALPGEMQE